MESPVKYSFEDWVLVFLKGHHCLSLQRLTPKMWGDPDALLRTSFSPFEGLFRGRKAKCSSHAALPLAIHHPPSRQVCPAPRWAVCNVSVTLWPPQLAQILPTEENFLLCFRQHVGSSTEFMEVRPRRCLSPVFGARSIPSHPPHPPQMPGSGPLGDAKPLRAPLLSVVPECV